MVNCRFAMLFSAEEIEEPVRKKLTYKVPTKSRKNKTETKKEVRPRRSAGMYTGSGLRG